MSDLFFTKTPPLSDPHSGFNGFHAGTTVLKKGYVHGEGFAPLDCDVVLDRDVPIPLRDGVVIRADIFRPNHSSPVPAILCSSIFGKNGSYVTYDFVAERCGHPNRCDVPKSATSGLDAWECPDPAYWVFHDYAVVFMDPRGVGMSEGDAHYFGAQDASDNYDVIEWLAVQVWCSGRVTMAGNSWLGITQWYTAALNPPHLTCIAPWEGHGNMYRDEYMRGGIPHINIVRVNMCYGNHRMEDLPAAMRAYPLMNDYWEDKAANFEKITCPAYVVASYTSQVHAHGTFEGFRRLSSKEKWLRIHNTQEWSDQHRPENRADLLKFYDYYLKDVDNGWEHTPRVRMSVLDPGHQDIVYRDEVQFPLDRQQFKKLYLDCANEALVETKPAGIHISTYQGDDGKSILRFSVAFSADTEISGYCKLHLWAAAEDYYDMDIYAKLNKRDVNGRYVFNDGVTFQYSGPNAMLRASLRQLDPDKSTESEPYHTFRTPQLLERGTPVELELGFWPTSLLFHTGETLELVVAGFDYLGLDPAIDSIQDNDNFGRHTVYSGGRYDSYLLLPVIPAE